MKECKNPPLDSITCTFYFERDASSKWESVYVGSIFNDLKHFLPKAEDRTRVSHAMNQGTKQFRVSEAQVTCLTNDNDKYFLAVAGDQLEFKQEQRYYGWDVIKPLIVESYNTYKKHSNPSSVMSLELRYFNKIFILSSSFDLQDYFNIYPYYDTLGMPCSNFQLNLIFPFENGQLNLTLLSVPEDKGVETLILFDLVANVDLKLNDESIDNALEIAHSKIKDVFEKCLSNKTKELFS